MIKSTVNSKHIMKHIKRCVIAALFVLSALFFCMAALADEENAPKISDWGIFDEETGAKTSLNGTGVIYVPNGLVSNFQAHSTWGQYNIQSVNTYNPS